MSSTLGKLRSPSRTSSFNAMMIKGSLLVAVIWALMVCGVGADFPCNKPEQIHWIPKSGKRYKCLECPDCPEGSQPSVPCGSSVAYGTPVDCVSCQLGKTFSDKYGKSQCEACAVCTHGKVVKKNCTLFSNSDCDDDKCIEGYYRAPFIFNCLQCTECCNDGKDEIAKECANYPGKKCKVRSVPCTKLPTKSSQTTAKTTSSTQKTSTALRTIRTDGMKRPTPSVPSTWSGDNSPVDGGKAIKTDENNNENRKLFIGFIVLAALAMIPSAFFMVRQFSHNNFRFPCCAKSNSEEDAYGTISSNLNRSAAGSQQQLNPVDDMTLEQLEDRYLDVFDQMCLKLDNGRWWFRRDYERLAAKYDRISLQERNALRDEVQRVGGGGPSKQLMSQLQAKYGEQLRLRHFVLKLKEIGRNDIAQLLMPYIRQNVSNSPAQ